MHGAGFAELKNPVKDKSCFGLLAQFDEGSIVPTIGAAVNAYVATHRVKWGTENIGGRAEAVRNCLSGRCISSVVVSGLQAARLAPTCSFPSARPRMLLDDGSVEGTVLSYSGR